MPTRGGVASAENMRKRRLKRRLAQAVRAERLAQEQARREAQDAMRLRLALQAIPHSVVVWDEEGGVMLRNGPEPDPARTRSGDALIDAAVYELCRGAWRPSE